MYKRFDDERLRIAVNLADAYESLRAAERDRRRYPGRMAWKTINGQEYLYHLRDRAGNGRSLGPRSTATEQQFAIFEDGKKSAQDRIDAITPRLRTYAAQYRALRLPMISSQAAAILKEADIRGVLGKDVVVVGSTAIAAYQLEAGCRFNEPIDATADFDMAWVALDQPDEPMLWPALKAVDNTFTVNTERTFQARNAAAEEVELLVGPARAHSLGHEPMRPVALPEQDWLLNGDWVERVVCGFDGTPARIVAPDPRWFALQKAWLSQQNKRNPLKRPKDARQAQAIWKLVVEQMPQYAVDDKFDAEIPSVLTAARASLQAK